ncbi:signal transduction histidine kinase [Saccharomonospora marina XMU15]|uniref:Oxygen sensor histidine kinase NreB n=1 Tax=Saccharomonospora marina XMU15 TaxID=882083 RepID=H5X7I8_9PSEU|nr:GAF domain-containing sensor histidine kinase [Saccharomonospora marina]EHR50208.1 signal transduction histidine kinase [Saccharomonospora marina XMU15]
MRYRLGLADPERENALLVGIIEAISAGPELTLLAAKVAPLITAASNTDVCFVHVLDDTDRSMTLLGATPPFDEQVGAVRLPLGEGVTGWAASHGEPVVIVEHKERDPRYRYFPQLRGEDYTSMASVPMASKPGGLVGVLNVHTRARRDFTDRDVRLLTSIGSLLAGAIHQARLHRRLAARERAHERFTEQVIAAQETERRRLAADIHDGITQRLVSLRFHLDAAAGTLTEECGFAAGQVERARELADLTFDEARAAINGLRPPVLDDLGLADSLASLARSLDELDVVVDLEHCALPDHASIALYRIAQEALQNVVKHARTRVVRLSLLCDSSEVVLRISDNGLGFDRDATAFGDGLPSGGYGMVSMAERAELIGGRLVVTSRPGEGTTVTARVPVR